MPISTVEEVIKDLRAGKMIILVDDANRENEGDLAMAAEKVTAEDINFMAKHGRGLICLALTNEKADSLRLHPMTSINTSPFQTAFTVSIEARCGVSTGISAADRATTIRTAICDDCRPEDLVRPGHVFPLRSRDGGVLLRAGQTEGIVSCSTQLHAAPKTVPMGQLHFRVCEIRFIVCAHSHPKRPCAKIVIEEGDPVSVAPRFTKLRHLGAVPSQNIQRQDPGSVEKVTSWLRNHWPRSEWSPPGESAASQTISPHPRPQTNPIVWA